MIPVTATYRLQMRPDAFTFDDARKVVGYLHDLGISHLYLSPILTAVPGSMHGYDVIDPTTVSAGLGGRAGLEALSAAARERDMGLVVDIVPNHMGVERPDLNRSWWDVLRHGPTAEHADWYDIDWSVPGYEGRVVLPILGSAEDLDQLRLDVVDGERVLRYYDTVLPVRPDLDPAVVTPTEVHDQQHYRLVDWRSDVLGYRRFFTVTGLAAIRQEVPEVFADTHDQIGSWFTEDLVDGLRIDHPDGLADPTDYLWRLRELIGPDAWVVIEKILAYDESLDPILPVEGTTGYDILAVIDRLFVDPTGRDALTELGAARTGEPGDADWLHARTLELKRWVVTEQLVPELHRLVRALAGPDDDPRTLAAMIVEVIARIPVYRSDYRTTSLLLSEAIEAVAGLPGGPGEDIAVALSAALGRNRAAALRLQQLTGAATAKAVEDRLFYRTSRLVALQEVGGEPDLFAVAPAVAHTRLERWAREWPATMSAASTHDTKRSADVRTRIAVLSQVAARWARAVAQWEELAPSPDARTGLFLWQNLFGVWPADGEVTGEIRARVRAYALKAIREAGLRTSWNEPDEAFEEAVQTWLDAVIDGPVAAEITDLLTDVAPHAAADALARTVIGLLGPGVPDTYQGTEVWDDSLVDPDNRRPVDFAYRQELLGAMAGATLPPDEPTADATKLWVVSRSLRVRRDHPNAMVGGDYRPLRPIGIGADHLFAFARADRGDEPSVVVATTRLTVTFTDDLRAGTTLPLPDGEWVDALTGRTLTGSVSATDLFTHLPVVVLTRSSSPAPQQ
ncbi:malto-oligosyltrehalose synthase [Millisia brevis]|uniref:malto-oligosyltrehalose synthase n=1 Tax=Millisia brevis TaxID=264148 RepID=UPI00082C27DC|nr:malto-oligosyltrehalose synthase [Millisia brevis]